MSTRTDRVVLWCSLLSFAVLCCPLPFFVGRPQSECGCIVVIAFVFFAACHKLNRPITTKLFAMSAAAATARLLNFGRAAARRRPTGQRCTAREICTCAIFGVVVGGSVLWGIGLALFVRSSQVAPVWPASFRPPSSTHTRVDFDHFVDCSPLVVAVVSVFDGGAGELAAFAARRELARAVLAAALRANCSRDVPVVLVAGSPGHAVVAGARANEAEAAELLQTLADLQPEQGLPPNAWLLTQAARALGARPEAVLSELAVGPALPPGDVLLPGWEGGSRRGKEWPRANANSKFVWIGGSRFGEFSADLRALSEWGSVQTLVFADRADEFAERLALATGALVRGFDTVPRFFAEPPLVVGGPPLPVAQSILRIEYAVIIFLLMVSGIYYVGKKYVSGADMCEAAALAFVLGMFVHFFCFILVLATWSPYHGSCVAQQVCSCAWFESPAFDVPVAIQYPPQTFRDRWVRLEDPRTMPVSGAPACSTLYAEFHAGACVSGSRAARVVVTDSSLVGDTRAGFRDHRSEHGVCFDAPAAAMKEGFFVNLKLMKTGLMHVLFVCIWLLAYKMVSR